MKFLILPLLITSVLAYSQNCLFCKKVDTEASFLHSFSFCKDTMSCLADQWNYVNQWCKSKWMSGWELDIDRDCDSKTDSKGCANFASDPSYYGTFVNDTKFLAEGSKCTITIDAT